MLQIYLFKDKVPTVKEAETVCDKLPGTECSQMEYGTIEWTSGIGVGRLHPRCNHYQ